LSNLNMRNQFAQDQQQNQIGGLLGGFKLGQKMDFSEADGFGDYLTQFFQGG